MLTKTMNILRDKALARLARKPDLSLQGIIKLFRQANPHLLTKSGAYCQCHAISTEFHDILQQHGIKSEIVECYRYKGGYARADKRWRGERDVYHVVLRCKGKYSAWSAKQFDSHLPVPHVTKLKTLSNLWYSVSA